MFHHSIGLENRYQMPMQMIRSRAGVNSACSPAYRRAHDAANEPTKYDRRGVNQGCLATPRHHACLASGCIRGAQIAAVRPARTRPATTARTSGASSTGSSSQALACDGSAARGVTHAKCSWRLLRFATGEHRATRDIDVIEESHPRLSETVRGVPSFQNRRQPVV